MGNKPLSPKVYFKEKEKQVTEGPCCKGQFGLKPTALMPAEFQGRNLGPALLSYQFLQYNIQLNIAFLHASLALFAFFFYIPTMLPCYSFTQFICSTNIY